MRYSRWTIPSLVLFLLALSTLAGPAPASASVSTGRMVSLQARGSPKHSSAHRSKMAPALSNTAVNDTTADNRTTQSETTLAVYGSTLVAGYNDSAQGQLTGYSVSIDGGAHWSDGGYLSPVPTGASDYGDPSLTVDKNGTFYFVQMAHNGAGEFVTLSICIVSGSALGCGTPLSVSDDSTSTSDKPYSVYDPHNNRVYITWTSFARGSNAKTLELRYYDIASGSLNPTTYPLAAREASGTYPVVTSSGQTYIFFLDYATGPAIDYVTFDNGKVSTVLSVSSIQSASDTVNCGNQGMLEAFHTQAFDNSHAVRVLEYPTAVIDSSGNIDVTWEARPPGTGTISTIYVATLPAGSTSWNVQALANPILPGQTTPLIQWRPSLAVAGTTLAVTYYQVVPVPSSVRGYQIERDETNATASAHPSFGTACPISTQSWDADQTNPNFDHMFNCYMGDYDSSISSGTTIYSVWGDNRNSTAGIGPQPDVYAATVPVQPQPPSWKVVSSPNAGTGNNSLSGVAAVSTHDIWAVGSYGNSNGTAQTSIEQWNGTNWSVVSSRNVGTNSCILNSVAVVSANDAWAVGSSFNGTSNQTLIEQWNGSNWSIISSPNIGTGDNELNGIAVVSSNDVWAVGESFTNPNGFQTLIEHWDGTNWGIVASPNVEPNENFLKSVTVVSANDIWAVGFYTFGSGDQTLTEHWDGTSWSTITSPNVSSGYNILQGVSATSTSDVWAVGYNSHIVNNMDTFQTLIEHWNGTSWSVIASPNAGTDSNVLTSITAVSSNNIWTVGYHFHSFTNTINQVLIEHWDGSRWNIVSSPNVGTNSNTLNAVAIVSSSDIWAVGYFSDGSKNQTLTEHYS